VINSADIPGKGRQQNPKSIKRFIIKVQTRHLNGHPLQNLSVCNQNRSINGIAQSPELFHVVMECGILGEKSKFTGKEAFFHASSVNTTGGKTLSISLGKLAPKQDW
jgi:hypothetical protein